MRNSASCFLLANLVLLASVAFALDPVTGYFIGKGVERLLSGHDQVVEVAPKSLLSVSGILKDSPFRAASRKYCPEMSANIIGEAEKSVLIINSGLNDEAFMRKLVGKAKGGVSVKLVLEHLSRKLPGILIVRKKTDGLRAIVTDSENILLNLPDGSCLMIADSKELAGYFADAVK